MKLNERRAHRIAMLLWWDLTKTGASSKSKSKYYRLVKFMTNSCPLCEIYYDSISDLCVCEKCCMRTCEFDSVWYKWLEKCNSPYYANIIYETIYNKYKELGGCL
jgi:hypothetical protein